MLLVVMVDPGSPAADAGLLIGDSMVSVDGTRVTSGEDLKVALDGIDVRTEIALTIVRCGETAEITITAGERQQG